MSTTIKTITLPQSGTTIRYELERKRIKNINLRVRRDGSVHLSAPTREPADHIEAFLCQREEWLIVAMDKMSRRAEAHPDTAVLAAGDSLPYLGRTIRVTYHTVEGRRGHFSFDEESNLLTVTVPDPADPGWRRTALEAFERARTRLLVSGLLQKHFPAFAARGVPAPESVRYKFMTSRHGSCAARNRSLNFNARLCEYPYPFVEYVVVHELCHFLHPDHSPAFWREVDAILPDRKAREELGK